MKLAIQHPDGSLQVGEHAELFPRTSFPNSGPNAEFIAAHGALLVTDHLAHDPATQRLEAIAPVLDGGKVRIVKVVAIPAQELAEQQRQADLDAAITGDTVLANIQAMTPAQYDAWWSANVTNSAQAIGVLKRVVRVLVRRVL